MFKKCEPFPRWGCNITLKSRALRKGPHSTEGAQLFPSSFPQGRWGVMIIPPSRKRQESRFSTGRAESADVETCTSSDRGHRSDREQDMAGHSQTWPDLGRGVKTHTHRDRRRLNGGPLSSQRRQGSRQLQCGAARCWAKNPARTHEAASNHAGPPHPSPHTYCVARQASRVAICEAPSHSHRYAHAQPVYEGTVFDTAFTKNTPFSHNHTKKLMPKLYSQFPPPL